MCSVSHPLLHMAEEKCVPCCIVTLLCCRLFSGVSPKPDCLRPPGGPGANRPRGASTLLKKSSTSSSSMSSNRNSASAPIAGGRLVRGVAGGLPGAALPSTGLARSCDLSTSPVRSLPV